MGVPVSTPNQTLDLNNAVKGIQKFSDPVVPGEWLYNVIKISYMHTVVPKQRKSSRACLETDKISDGFSIAMGTLSIGHGFRIRLHQDHQRLYADLRITLPETNMETQKGHYKDYRSSKKGAIWASMLVWGSVGFQVPPCMP